MTRTVHCSFCGKSQHDVREIVAADNAAICDACVRTCVSVLFAARGKFMFWLGAEAEAV